MSRTRKLVAAHFARVWPTLDAIDLLIRLGRSNENDLSVPADVHAYSGVIFRRVVAVAGSVIGPDCLCGSVAHGGDNFYSFTGSLLLMNRG